MSSYCLKPWLLLNILTHWQKNLQPSAGRHFVTELSCCIKALLVINYYLPPCFHLEFNCYPTGTDTVSLSVLTAIFQVNLD